MVKPMIDTFGKEKKKNPHNDSHERPGFQEISSIIQHRLIKKKKRMAERNVNINILSIWNISKANDAE